MAGKGKPRPDVALTVKSSGDVVPPVPAGKPRPVVLGVNPSGNVVSVVPVVRPPPDPYALAAKVKGLAALTPEERGYLIMLLEKQVAHQRVSLTAEERKYLTTCSKRTQPR
jgi:hypothetical protein